MEHRDVIELVPEEAFREPFHSNCNVVAIVNCHPEHIWESLSSEYIDSFPPSSPDMLRMLEDEVKLAMMLDKQVWSQSLGEVWKEMKVIVIRWWRWRKRWWCPLPSSRRQPGYEERKMMRQVNSPDFLKHCQVLEMCQIILDLFRTSSGHCCKLFSKYFFSGNRTSSSSNNAVSSGSGGRVPGYSMWSCEVQLRDEFMWSSSQRCIYYLSPNIDVERKGFQANIPQAWCPNVNTCCTIVDSGLWL